MIPSDFVKWIHANFVFNDVNIGLRAGRTAMPASWPSSIGAVSRQHLNTFYALYFIYFIEFDVYFHTRNSLIILKPQQSNENIVSQKFSRRSTKCRKYVKKSPSLVLPTKSIPGVSCFGINTTLHFEQKISVAHASDSQHFGRYFPFNDFVTFHELLP